MAERRRRSSVFDKDDVEFLRYYLEQFLTPNIFHRFVLVMYEIHHATYIPDNNTHDQMGLASDMYAEAYRRLYLNNEPCDSYRFEAFRYALAAHLSRSADAVRLRVPPPVDLAVSLSWDVRAAVDPEEFTRYENIWGEVKQACTEHRFGPEESKEALRKASEILKPYEHLSRRLLELPWPHLQGSEVEFPPTENPDASTQGQDE